MATRKPTSTEPADKKPTTGSKSGSDKTTFGERAHAIATDARAFADNTRERLAELSARCIELNDVDPGEDTAADALRRLPMALQDADTVAQGLAGIAADLAARTVR